MNPCSSKIAVIKLLCLAFIVIGGKRGLQVVTALKPKILVIGATGSTGLRAIQGLLDVGYRPRQIRLLTRNAKNAKCKALRKRGFDIVQADLEDKQSLAEKRITRGCVGCYVHSTSSDTAELDSGEVMRAQNLASTIVEENNKICHIVYNSAAAPKNHGVKRITQKHDVEKVFQTAVNDWNTNNQKSDKKTMSFTSLRANIFMEELWKVYTRPKILAGTYPLPVPSNRKIYLLSVRDLGRMAGMIIRGSSWTGPSVVRTINVAGEYMSATDIAEAFAMAQGSPCTHCNPRMMTFKAWWYFPELYEQIRFLQTSTEATDIEDVKSEFSGAVTAFAKFLEETKWGNRDLTFADFSEVANLK